MTSQLPDIISAEQKNMIFENMSDGVITLDSAGRITYCNSACCKILKISAISDILGQSFPELFLQNKKNRAFNKLFRDSMEKHKVFPKTPVRYRFGKEKELHHFNIDISLLNPPKNEIFNPDSPYKNPNTAFNGMVILIEDDTDRFNLRQHEHDCAFIFAGLILCISVFLMSWSLMRFTLHIYLKSSVYTQIIEFITFLLFLEIVFLTSFSMRDIGLIPKNIDIEKKYYRDCRDGVDCLLCSPSEQSGSVIAWISDKSLLYRRLTSRSIHIYIHGICSGISGTWRNTDKCKIIDESKISKIFQYFPYISALFTYAYAFRILFYVRCIHAKPRLRLYI